MLLLITGLESATALATSQERGLPKPELSPLGTARSKKPGLQTAGCFGGEDRREGGGYVLPLGFLARGLSPESALASRMRKMLEEKGALSPSDLSIYICKHRRTPKGWF